MKLPVFSADDFLAAFQRLLPRGRIWPREPDAIQTQTLSTLMPLWERLAARDNNLVVDGFPATANEVLPDWEKATGLPDPCLGASPTLAQRQAQLVARIGMAGGASIPDMTAFAAALGYTITVTEFAAARFGRSRFGDPMFDERWAYVWNVTCDPAAVTLLSCELNRIRAAHTTLLFNFSE